jgi:hypothetical protein
MPDRSFSQIPLAAVKQIHFASFLKRHPVLAHPDPCHIHPSLLYLYCQIIFKTIKKW